MAGRYFNDPGIAAAVSNLAGAFAPPSAEEYLLAEEVKGKRTTNAALADMYGLAGGDFDKLGILANLFDPSNSYYSVDTQAATARRGQDVTANTAIATNEADNDRALREALLEGVMDPMGRQSVDEQMLNAILPGAGLPGVTAAQPVAPTETQAMGAIIAGLSDDESRALLDPSTVQTLGPDGQPIITAEIDAIGQPAYNNPGGTAAPDPVMLINPDTGERISGFATPQGTYVLGDGKTPAPANLVAYKLPQIAGSESEVGGGTGANRTAYNNIQAITAESDMLVDSLVAKVEAKRGAVGFAGTLQNLQQNIGQVLLELNAAYGNEDVGVPREVLDSMAPPGMAFDPVYAELRKGILDLAYLEANKGNPGGEVSRFALERQLETLSQGILANDQAFLAAMGMIKEGNARARAAAEARIGNPVVPPAQPGTGAPPSTGATPQLSPEAQKWLGAP
jgi:hypothetical protein